MCIRRATALIVAFGLIAAAPPPPLHPALAPYAGSMLPRSPHSGGELRVRFMGASTLLFDDGDTAILIDGFFSRPDGSQLAVSRLRPDPVRIDDALDRAEISRLDAVIAAHSHYDHAMDSAVIADRFDALLVGTRSTACIGRGAGLPDSAILTVAGGDRFAIGRFQVTVIGSYHALPNLAPGTIDAPLSPPAHARAYKEGGSLSFLIQHRGLRMLVHATAGFRRGDMAGITDVDAVFLGMGGLGLRSRRFQRDYWRELVRGTGAKLVIPVHWDNFLRRLDDRPLQPTPGFASSMGAATRRARSEGRKIGLMPLYAPVDIASAVPAGLVPGPAPVGRPVGSPGACPG